MRLFTGIDIPDSVKANLNLLLRKLRPTAELKWSRVENLHITTKFIGEWPPERLDELKAALAAVGARAAIPVEIAGIEWFPNAKAPRVLYAGIAAPPKLAELARDTEQALVPLGIAAECRAFSPHLTLARIKAPGGLGRLRQALEGLPELEFGAFTADRFYLYESELGRGGSTYTKIAEFPLARGD